MEESNVDSSGSENRGGRSEETTKSKEETAESKEETTESKEETTESKEETAEQVRKEYKVNFCKLLWLLKLWLKVLSKMVEQKLFWCCKSSLISFIF